MIGFIGCGNMAQAMIAGLRTKQVIVYDPSKEKLEEARKRFGVRIAKSNIEVAEKSSIIVIAVKPKDVIDVLCEISSKIKDKVVISIAAGITIKKIKSAIGNKKIVRVMPNTPCLVNEMAAGYSTLNLTNSEERRVYEFLSTFGLALKMDEKKLDIVTAISGSGPAFIAYIIDEYSKAGGRIGMDDATSYALSLKTFKGTIKMLSEKNLTPKDLIEMVSSPKGTTVAGREILENSKIQDMFFKTMSRAKSRAKELGK